MLLNLHPLVILINLLVLGVAMTVHEFAHNYVAWKMGDPVPEKQGRLTLNPLVHIHWVGWLMFAVIGFGILGSVPISANRMRDPRWGFLAAVAAGPFSNLGLAIISGILLRILGAGQNSFAMYFRPDLISTPMDIIMAILFAMVYLNVLLFVFNLIPLFPIDGWHIVLTLLPGSFLNRMQIPVVIQQNVRPLAEFLMRPAFKWKEWQTISYYAFMLLILLSFLPGNLPSPLGIIITQPTIQITFALIG